MVAYKTDELFHCFKDSQAPLCSLGIYTQAVKRQNFGNSSSKTVLNNISDSPPNLWGSNGHKSQWGGNLLGLLLVRRPVLFLLWLDSLTGVSKAAIICHCPIYTSAICGQADLLLLYLGDNSYGQMGPMRCGIRLHHSVPALSLLPYPSSGTPLTSHCYYSTYKRCVLWGL